MSNAAHISGQNAPFTLPYSPALRGCNHCVVADAFTSSLHVGQQGNCALWMSALAATRKPSTMRSMKRLSPWPLPCLYGHTLRGLSCARRHSVFCFDFTTPTRKERASWAPDSSPFGSRFLPEQVCKLRPRAPRKLLPGPSQKAARRRLGAWPTRSGSADG
jgi:hypothetical protein